MGLRDAVVYDIEVICLDGWWRLRPWRARILRAHVPRDYRNFGAKDIVELSRQPTYYGKTREEAVTKAQQRCWEFEQNYERLPTVVQHQPNRRPGITVDHDDDGREGFTIASSDNERGKPNMLSAGDVDDAYRAATTKLEGKSRE